MPRVFLDANVILSAVLSGEGPAARLRSVADSVQFYTADFVVGECYRRLEEDAPELSVARYFRVRVDQYIVALNTMFLSGASSADGEERQFGDDPGDWPVVRAALQSDCEFLCTYNDKDFPGDSPDIRSPFSLLAEFNRFDVINIVQKTFLSNTGTVLFVGTPQGSLGKLLYSSSGVTVYQNSSGELVAEGEGVERSEPIEPLIRGQGIVLTFRYSNSGDFKGELWDDDGTSRLVINGKAEFSDDTQTLLCKPNSGFGGTVVNVSAIPRFVRDKRIPWVLKNRTLEAVIGSVGVREILTGLDVVTHDGREFIRRPFRQGLL